MTGSITTSPIGQFPGELKSVSQWVVWRFETRDGKTTKIPYNPLFPDQKAKANDAVTWSTFQKAEEVRRSRKFDGIGFEFTKPYVGIDFDHVRDKTTGEIDPEVLEEIGLLDSYTEISPSGEGLHVIIKGTIPGPRRRAGPREMYTDGRFFTMTGDRLDWTPDTVNESQDALEYLYQKWFSEPEAKQESPCTERTSNGCSLSDDEIIKLASSAANNRKFEALMRGDTSGYPSSSEADSALACLLAFYTKDYHQVLRLVRRSGLWDEKWERPDYQKSTIDGALSVVREQYKPQRFNLSRLKESHSFSDDDHQASKDPLCMDFPQTDLGNAARFTTRYCEDIRYCYPWCTWFIWTGSVWEPDEKGTVQALGKIAVLRLGYEAGLIKDDAKRALAFKWAAKSQAKARIDAMISLAQPDVALLPIQMDANKSLLNCRNGTLELDTFSFREHRREDICTKAISVDYDPNAECPLFRAFLSEIFANNEALIKFVQRAFGYSLTAHIGERVLFLCHGSGANGKSTLLNAIATMMGDYARQTESATFLVQRNETVRNDVAALQGRRLVIATEAPKGKRLDESLVKQLTGGDRVTARFLYKELFEFVPDFKIWWCFNHRPSIDDPTNSIWDRIRLIPFQVTIPPERRDVDLQKKLALEGPGVLNWMIEGLQEYRRIGLAEPNEVRNATNEYRETEDRLGDFLAEKCSTDNPAIETLAVELYTTYHKWCTDNREDPMSQKKFGSDMGERFTRVRDKDGKRGYKGVYLKEQGRVPVEPELQNRRILTDETSNPDNTQVKIHKSLSGNLINASGCVGLDNPPLVADGGGQP